VFYAWDITIPANTLLTAPVEQTLKITNGVIVRISVKFPSGCHGLVKMRLLRWRFQVVPLSGGEWLTGDDETVDFPEYYEITKDPFELKFVGTSPGTCFPHSLAVRVVVLPKAVASFYPLAQALQKLLSRLFGPLEVE